MEVNGFLPVAGIGLLGGVAVEALRRPPSEPPSREGAATSQ
jgi:hypothetical protein